MPYFVSITTNEFPVEVIVEPLNVILQEQHAQYGDKSIIINSELTKALLKNSCEGDVKKLRKGQFWYILGHPEYLLFDCMWTVYKSPEWSLRRIFVVVNEAHCIVMWDDRFREDMGRLDYYVRYHEQL